MTRRVTVTLSDDEYAKAEHFAARCEQPLASWCGDVIAGAVDCYTDAEIDEAYERLAWFAAVQPIGNA